MSRIVRVFPRRTKATPTDEYAFVGDPPLFRPDADEVHVSCTFTWDIPEAHRLAKAWAQYYSTVRIGGPAFDDPGAEFVPGRYLKPGYVITSRGCPNHCDHCFVPDREGKLRTYPVTYGWDVLDNNLLACPREHIEAVLAMLREQPHPIRFTGGLEASRVQPWFVKAACRLRIEAVWMAYDRPAQKPYVHRAIEMFRDIGGWHESKMRRTLRCYVLVGFGDDTIAGAIERLEWVRLSGPCPMPMVYRPKKDPDEERIVTFKRALRKWLRPVAMYAKTGDTE